MLAVFDGLLFPLLVLDALIAWLVFLFGVGFLGWSRNYDDAHNAQLIFLTGIISGGVDFLVVHNVWRAANRTGASSEKRLPPRLGNPPARC